MSIAHSKNHTLLVGEETSFGTAVTADKDLGLIQNFNPMQKRNHEKLYASGSREIQEIVEGNYEVNFDGEIILQHGRPIYYVMGSVSHAETTSDWKHTFDFGTSVPSLTIEDSHNMDTDAVFIYDGCKLDEATMSIEKNGQLKMSFSGQGQASDHSTASASSAVISTLPVLTYKHLSVSIGTAGSESSVGKVQSASLTFSNSLERIDAAGNITAQELNEGNIDITGEFTIIFEDMTEYDRFLGEAGDDTPQLSQTGYSLVINAHNGVTLGSGRREFYVQLSGVKYEEADKPVNVGESVVGTFKFNAEGLGTNKAYYVDSVSSTNF